MTGKDSAIRDLYFETLKSELMRADHVATVALRFLLVLDASKIGRTKLRARELCGSSCLSQMHLSSI